MVDKFDAAYRCFQAILSKKISENCQTLQIIMIVYNLIKESNYSDHFDI